jgi:hypothetical protein
MKSIFINESGRLRNGWWALIYLAILVPCIIGTQRLAPVFQRLGIPSGDWMAGVFFLVSLLATWICTRLQREPLASAGWRLDGRWAKEFGWGTLFGAGVMLLAAGLLWAVGGVTWELDPARSFRALGVGFALFLLVALLEENLFRGFVFQRLLDGVGVWPTQAILALFFGLAHWGNPGMHGATKVWATFDIALAAVFLGLAYLRTRSLALPIGLHLGWNWTQGNVLGFGVSGTTTQRGWIHPVFQGKPEWVSGGAFGLEASIFGVVAVLVGIALLWKWKGSATA